MCRKQFTSVIKAVIPFAVVLVIAAFPFKEVTMKNLLQEIFVLAIYFLLIIGYLLRIVLPFVGIFALYNLLKRRVNEQLTVKDFEQALNASQFDSAKHLRHSRGWDKNQSLSEELLNDQADYLAILDAEIVI